MRKAHDEKPWVRERMRQEIRSSPQYQALSPLCCYAVPKTRKYKKIEPWAVSSKNQRTRKIDARKNKVAVAGSRAKFRQSVRRRISDRAKLYSLARRRFIDRAKLNSLARRCFPDRAKLNSLARRRFPSRAKFRQSHAKSYRARAKKEDSGGDSRAEESSRAARRESSREYSVARVKVNDLAQNSAPDRTDCMDSD